MKYIRKQAVLIICIYIFAFQNFLQIYILPFQYWDELIALLFIPILIMEIKKHQGKLYITKRNSILLLFFAGFLLSGIIGNCIYRYQPLLVVLKDILLCSKFLMAYGGAYIFFQNSNINFNQVRRHTKFIICVLFTLTVSDYCFHIFPATERYGLRAEQLFYSHTTYFVAALTFIGVIYIDGSKLKREWYIIAMLVTMLFSTLRAKAIVFVVLSFGLGYFILIKKKRITLTKWFLLGTISVFAGWSQIEFYFIKLAGKSARSILLMSAFDIAKKCFPFGTGFATYGSQAAADNYSPVYTMLHFNKIYELSAKTGYLADSFWPMIIGQTGVIGTLCFIGFVLTLLWIILKTLKYNSKYYYQGLLILIYLLISSTSELAFVNPLAVPLALWLGILIGKGEQDEKSKSSNHMHNTVSNIYSH